MHSHCDISKIILHFKFKLNENIFIHHHPEFKKNLLKNAIAELPIP